ncbi:hypothetical protein V8E51_003088 [Hyaloscypha variabilis]
MSDNPILSGNPQGQPSQPALAPSGGANPNQQLVPFISLAGGAFALTAGQALPQGQWIMVVAGQQLTGFCHNSLQNQALALPGQNVLVNPNRIAIGQVVTQRQSYINAILIQRGGVNMTDTPCRTCARTGLANTTFPECRRIIGQWNNCCGNCKWPDHAASCTWPGESDDESEEYRGSGANINKNQKDCQIRIGILGKTGTGKSSVLDSVTGFNLLPKNAQSLSTAVPVETSYDHDDNPAHAFETIIEGIGRLGFEREIKIFSSSNSVMIWASRATVKRMKLIVRCISQSSRHLKRSSVSIPHFENSTILTKPLHGNSSASSVIP